MEAGGYGEYGSGYVVAAPASAYAWWPPPWEEAFDDASQLPYWYHAQTGEAVWEKPLALRYTRDETYLLTRLQAIVRGRCTRNRLMWASLFRRLDDAYRNAARLAKRNKSLRAVEELAYAREVLLPHKNEHLDKWAELSSKLRNLCANTQADLFWQADREVKAHQLREAMATYGQARRAVEIMGSASGLFSARMPLLVSGEGNAALRFVAVRIAASLQLEGIKRSRIMKTLDRLGLRHACTRETGVPHERWSTSSGIAVEVAALQKKRANEAVWAARRASTRQPSSSGSEGSNKEEDDDEDDFDEGSGSDNGAVASEKENDEVGSGSDFDSRIDSDSSRSEDEENQDWYVDDMNANDELAESVELEDSLARRLVGCANICLRYQLEIDRLVELDDLDGELPADQLDSENQREREEQHLKQPTTASEERSSVSSSASSGSDSDATSSDSDSDIDKKKQRGREAVQAAAATAQTTKKRKRKEPVPSYYEPRTLNQLSAVFRTAQVGIAVVLHEHMMGSDKAKERLLAECPGKYGCMKEETLFACAHVLEPLLARVVLTLGDEAPMNEDHPAYRKLRHFAAEALSDCRQRTYRAIAGQLDTDWNNLDDRLIRYGQKRRKGMWQCKACYLFNKPNLQSCTGCHARRPRTMSPQEIEQRRLRDECRVQHLEAALRARRAAAVCEDIGRRYPLQSMVVMARMMYVLDARSLVAAARAMPLDYHHQQQRRNRYIEEHTPFFSAWAQQGEDEASELDGKALGEVDLSLLSSVELLQRANEDLSVHWRHSTTLLLEVRVLLYSCIWVRLKENFDKAASLYQNQEHTRSAARRFRVTGNQCLDLLAWLREEIASERGRKRLDYTWKVKGNNSNKTEKQEETEPQQIQLQQVVSEDENTEHDRFFASEDAENSGGDEVDEEVEEDDGCDPWTLRVSFINARGLKKADRLGKSDPYVKIFVNGAFIGRSTRRNNTLNPDWDKETHEFIVRKPRSEDNSWRKAGAIVFEVLDFDSVGSHDSLGQVVVSGGALSAAPLRSDGTPVPEEDEEDEDERTIITIHVTDEPLMEAPGARKSRKGQNKKRSKNKKPQANDALYVPKPTQGTLTLTASLVRAQDPRRVAALERARRDALRAPPMEELSYWGPRVGFMYPLGEHAGRMPFVDPGLISLQMTKKERACVFPPLPPPPDNPILTVTLAFERHVRTMGVRSFANAGAARDKIKQYGRAKQAYIEALDLLDDHITRPQREAEATAAAAAAEEKRQRELEQLGDEASKKQQRKKKQKKRNKKKSKKKKDKDIAQGLKSSVDDVPVAPIPAATSLISSSPIRAVRRRALLAPIHDGPRLKGVIRRHLAMSMTRYQRQIFAQGIAKLRGGEYMAACVHFSAIVSRAPEVVERISNFQMPNSALAVSHLKLWALGNLGRCLEKVREWDAAEEVLLQCAEFAKQLEPLTQDRRPEIQALMRIALLSVDRARGNEQGLCMAEARCRAVQAACCMEELADAKVYENSHVSHPHAETMDKVHRATQVLEDSKQQLLWILEDESSGVVSLDTPRREALEVKVLEAHYMIEELNNVHAECDDLGQGPGLGRRDRMHRWLSGANRGAENLLISIKLWRKVERGGRCEYAAGVIARFWRVCVARRFLRDMRDKMYRRCATLLQACFRQHLARRLLEWKRLLRHTKSIVLPVKHRGVTRMQTWWSKRSGEIKESTETAHYFAVVIQRYQRGHAERAFHLPQRRQKALLRAKRDLRRECATLIQAIYRGYLCRMQFQNSLGDFKTVLWREFMDSMAARIQRVVRFHLGRKQRAYLVELRRDALMLEVREKGAVRIQARMFRGPRDRKRAYMLASARCIQKLFRGFYIRRREHRMWRSLKRQRVGGMAWRPKPLRRKTFFLGAADVHLFGEGSNNWELKERVGRLPDDVLHSVGFKKKHAIKVVPNRPVFFNKRAQEHKRRMLEDERRVAAERALQGSFKCRKCGQTGKYPGHICCCHKKPSCVSCQKNQRSIRVNGRPGKRRCDQRIKLVHRPEEEDKKGEPSVGEALPNALGAGIQMRRPPPIMT